MSTRLDESDAPPATDHDCDRCGKSILGEPVTVNVDGLILQGEGVHARLCTRCADSFTRWFSRRNAGKSLTSRPSGKDELRSGEKKARSSRGRRRPIASLRRNRRHYQRLALMIVIMFLLSYYIIASMMRIRIE